MPKDNEVDEKVIWTTDKPTTEGAYYIRGFNLCREKQYEALVQVKSHHYFGDSEAELCCNLHASTSEENMDDWIPVIELQDDFEWSGPLVSAATVAELRAEVERLRSINSSLVDKCNRLNLCGAQSEQRADAAERRVGEAINKLNVMELMAREAGFAEGIGGIEGKDLTALKAMFTRLADHLEDARNTLTGADPT